jgi:pimeloyl-ACP methyl ester carboxylesterase
MAHVFGAERRWGLAPFAERFARAGIAALVFDYRHLGGSDGVPRRLVDPGRQLEDWRSAIDFVRAREAVDAERVALWGSSFSGGHVLVTASREPGIAAVVAQVPFLDGRATIAHQSRDSGPIERLRTIGLGVADRFGAAIGRGPICMPIVSAPGDGGLVDSPGAMAGFESLAPEAIEEQAVVEGREANETMRPINRTPARVVLDLPSYRPGRSADAIDAPVHVVVAEEDRLLPPGPTERLIRRLSDPSVDRVPAGHFDVHGDPWFEPVVNEQVAFLTEAVTIDS